VGKGGEVEPHSPVILGGVKEGTEKSLLLTIAKRSQVTLYDRKAREKLRNPGGRTTLYLPRCGAPVLSASFYFRPSNAVS